MVINVLEYLEETEKKYSNSPAFVDENGVYSYAQLVEYGKKIGTVLASIGIIRKPIAVYLEKGKEEVASFMGILYGGGFYCPIDINMPLERIANIFNTLNPAAIISDEGNIESLKSLNLEIPCLIYEELIVSESDDNCLKDIRNQIIDLDPAYVLFTSGSTGTPKGVVITHQSIVDYIEWVSDTFNINHDDRLGNQAPLYFDNSTLDLYCGLRNGATVFIIPRETLKFPVMLLEYLDKNRITTVFFVPSVLSMVVKIRAFTKIVPRSLRKILFAGEVMPTKDLNVWRQYIPNAIYANLYGPTEITVDCTYYIVDREFADDEPLPIGKACRNSGILILRDDKTEAGVLEEGELCVRGRSLALGYYNNQERSDSVFIQNPLNTFYREYIYCTGDLVKMNEQGEILYIGRKDFQIKHMGQRIELGEIETAAGSISGLMTGACIYDDKRRKIVFVYSGENLAPDAIKAFLSEKIPEYMIPDKYIRIDDFPLNSNGKIDRKLLKELYVSERLIDLNE